MNEALRRARAVGAGTDDTSDSATLATPWTIEPEPPGPTAVRAATDPIAAPMLTPAPEYGLPRLNSRLQERLASSAGCDRALVEQYRRLAATLHTAQAASGLRLILVSSAVPGDGKTLTSINLAVVLSESYKRRVLLVDADLRRPSIGEVFDVDGSMGLSAALKAPTDQKLVTVPLSPTLTLLPAGAPDPDPLSGLTSTRMRRILDEAVEQFDWVILDGPPTGPLAETSLLAQMVQGTLLVVRAGQTQYPAVQQAIDGLGRERILGVVLNGVNDAGMRGYGDYYYGAAKSPKSPTRD